jgi:Protein of unknown function (DUF2855)
MDFVVNREHLEDTATVPSAPLTIHEGDILVRIESWAFTANNVSYAATGDALQYWKFFPATDDHNGRVPVWGVGVIVASLHSSPFLLNRRVYGYFPMSHYVVMQPVSVTQSDFVDGTPHRRNLPAVYNQYLLCDEDPFYSPRTVEAMMVLRPLFFTSWLLLDFFTHSANTNIHGVPFFGAKTCILSSASSKTSIGFAFLLYQYNNQQKLDGAKIHTVGLTSAQNQAFVESLRIYDRVILYDNLEQQLHATVPSCFVDMAGNTHVTTRLHRHLQANMKYTCLVGAAHVGQGGKPSQKLPGARPKFFFAPSWTAQRVIELGGGTSDHKKRRGMKVREQRIGFLNDLHAFS